MHAAKSDQLHLWFKSREPRVQRPLFQPPRPLCVLSPSPRVLFTRCHYTFASTLTSVCGHRSWKLSYPPLKSLPLQQSRSTLRVRYSPSFAIPYGKFLLIHIIQTVSSTIDVVAMPTDYYENWMRGQGGQYFDDTSFLGVYPSGGNSLSIATTDVCLDYCSGGCPLPYPPLYCACSLAL